MGSFTIDRSADALIICSSDYIAAVCAGSIPVPSGAENPEAMETAEDAALLASSSSDGDQDADEGNDDTATAREDAVRAAGEVSTLRLAQPEPSGAGDDDSRAAVMQRPGAAKVKRKEGGRSATAKQEADQTADHRRGSQRNNKRTDASIRKKPKRTPASVTMS